LVNHDLRQEGDFLSSRERLLSFLEKQIKVENEIVDSLNRGLVDVENPAVKGTLKGISLDSLKHAQMYASAINLLTKAPKALTQKQLDSQKALVEKHIQIEAVLIERISEQVPNIRDEKVKLLLNAILEDEKRHHSLLQRVLEILVRGEAITEEEWFEVVWRSVPFHGAPGG
jgi:rubrerythrin